MRYCWVWVAVLGCLAGCGGSGRSPIVGRVKIEYTSPGDVRRFATEYRLTPLAHGGRPLRSSTTHRIEQSVEIPNVPGDAVALLFEFIGGGGGIVGQTRVPVDFSDGAETVQLHGNPAGYVHFVENDSDTTIMIGSTSVFIAGVGFDYTQLDEVNPGQWMAYVDPGIANLGANCIRLYGLPWNSGGVTNPGSPAYQAQFTSDMLAYAAAHGMYVLVGVYVDGSATTSRVTDFVNLIQGDPNFSRVIGYCVGNEVDSGFFSTVNNLASTIKALQTTPAQVRPIMTALPSVSEGFVATIQAQMPNLDWLGVNTFYGHFDALHAGGGYLNTQAASLASGGWTKPWAITEYYSYDIQAPDMPNQVMNGASKGYMLECNSTLNAQNYANSYSQYIASADAKSKGSVGGFMLNYGPPHNSKLVASWLEPWAYTGQFTPFYNPPWNNGANQFIRFAATDAVAAIYGGSFPNPCPQIVLGADNDPQGISCSFKATLTGPGVAQAGGAQITATVIAQDSETLSFMWYLIGGTSAGFNGDITAPGLNPQAYEEPTTYFLGTGVSTPGTGNQVSNTLTVDLPAPKNAASNNYQLRVIVSDPSGGGATAAIGFPMQ
ncbi:MAG TPA: hypothetical protein PLL78_07630 [Fimbriimonadaceae bacterium]|nr:hypothetical protein [Fimbriimonadaceae bacterium]HRJ96544.1 hypothetical protein [Fimbriimonadaceae bacterium]